jgi:hypothetical protein
MKTSSKIYSMILNLPHFLIDKRIKNWTKKYKKNDLNHQISISARISKLIRNLFSNYQTKNLRKIMNNCKKSYLKNLKFQTTIK